MRETDAGLYVEAKLDLEGSAVAREVWRSVKADAIGVSFGYLTVKERRANDANELLELDLFEVSLTPQPANPDALVLSAKSLPPIRIAKFENMREDQRWPGRDRLLKAGWRPCTTPGCFTVLDPKHGRGEYCGTCKGEQKRRKA